MIRRTMTINQFLEYEKIKEQLKNIDKRNIYIAIIGSVLSLGKTLSGQIGFSYISYLFYMSSKTFFWLLIFSSLIKGIKNTCNKDLTGIGQIIGCVISSILMIVL